jgi:hypothetical protein
MRSSMFMIGLATGLLAASSAWADPQPSAPPATPAPAAAPPAAEAPAPPPPVDAEEERTANNALYLEGLGPGILYSIDYDRTFGDFAGRVGFGYLSVSVSSGSSSGTTQATSSASIFTIPITLSYLGVGTKRNMLELGLGATILHAGAGATTIDANSSSSANASATVVLPVAIVGYRYQPPHGGFLFRGGLSPIFAGSSLPVLPWPYVALGGTF